VAGNTASRIWIPDTDHIADLDALDTLRIDCHCRHSCSLGPLESDLLVVEPWAKVIVTAPVNVGSHALPRDMGWSWAIRIRPGGYLGHFCTLGLLGFDLPVAEAWAKAIVTALVNVGSHAHPRDRGWSWAIQT
jgi:hypothetical protein